MENAQRAKERELRKLEKAREDHEAATTRALEELKAMRRREEEEHAATMRRLQEEEDATRGDVDARMEGIRHQLEERKREMLMLHRRRQRLLEQQLRDAREGRRRELCANPGAFLQQEMECAICYDACPRGDGVMCNHQGGGGGGRGEGVAANQEDGRHFFCPGCFIDMVKVRESPKGASHRVVYVGNLAIGRGQFPA